MSRARQSVRWLDSIASFVADPHFLVTAGALAAGAYVAWQNITDKNVKIVVYIVEFVLAMNAFVMVRILRKVGHHREHYRRNHEDLRSTLERNYRELLDLLGEVTSLRRLEAKPLFREIANRSRDRLRRDIDGMTHGTYTKDVSLPRQELIDLFTLFLGRLNGQSFYDTLSIPEFWSNQHLGGTPEFSVVNDTAAKNGVKIRRLFLVRRDVTQRELDILGKYQREMTFPTSIESKVMIIDHFESDALSAYGNYAIIGTDGEASLLIEMNYDRTRGKDNWVFSEVKVTEDLPAVGRKHLIFKSLFANSTLTLNEYLLQNQVALRAAPATEPQAASPREAPVTSSAAP